MIDFHKEEPLHWRDALQVPEFRTKTNNPTASRWHAFTKRGIKGTTGERIKLECVRLPHGPHTSREAITRFVKRLNGVDVDAENAHTSVVDDAGAAMRELETAGLC